MNKEAIKRCIDDFIEKSQLLDFESDIEDLERNTDDIEICDLLQDIADTSDNLFELLGDLYLLVED